MKVIAVLALVFAASEAAISSIPCDDCKEFATAIQRHHMTFVNEDSGLLVISLCPGAENVTLCNEGILTYWPAFAAAMYPVFFKAESVCGLIGACEKRLWTFHEVVEPTCDQCKEGVAAFANVLGSEGTILDIVGFLKGNGYCAGAGDEKCADAVDMLIPAAMPVLAANFVEASGIYCCDLSTSGVCCPFLDH